MSTTTNPPIPQTATLTALCCECGEVRTVSKRGTSNERTLRCAACKAPRLHAVIGSQSDDYKESFNARVNKTLLEVQRNIDHIERLGIRVDYGRPQGGRCQIDHFVDRTKLEWRILLADDLDPAQTLRTIEWAWKTMLPSWVEDYDAIWNGPVCPGPLGDSRGSYLKPDCNY